MAKTPAEIFPVVDSTLTLSQVEKRKRAEQAILEINHKFGREALRFGHLAPVARVPTGLASLDLLLRQVDRTTNTVVGYGLPRGQFTMIWGPRGAGKSALLYQVIHAVQTTEGVAAFIDAEHKLDRIWAQQNGVDLDALAVGTPDTLEQVCYSVEHLASAGVFDLAVIDSVVSIASSAELHDSKGKEFD